MSSVQIFLTDEEDKKITSFKEKWKLPKYKTIKKIINDFKEKDEN